MNPIRNITIVEHRPDWPEEFAAIARPLHEALGGLALRIDHIGSTAVPGLAAKDIIDVQVTVRDFTPELDAAFLMAGYPRRADITRDHRPPTDLGPDRDWEKQYYQPLPGARLSHVHARRSGSANGRYALLFRDYLRAHPLAAAAYAQAKVALARHDSTNWDLYYEVKDPICDIIMAGAEDWAVFAPWRCEHYV
ncbi:MAG TPA: GrpB family protein [Chloroflexota bacterium]|nr:GrpB family protein [Chloroflexota bacterium]